MLTTQVPYYLLEVCFESSQKLLSFLENWMEYWSRWREMKPHGTKKLDFWELHPSEGQKQHVESAKISCDKFVVIFKMHGRRAWKRDRLQML